MIDDAMDIAWFKIVEGVHDIKEILDILVAPLNAIGPVAAISVIALLTVAFTKGLSRVVVTKRYKKLEKEFDHWYHVRQQAADCKDMEKGKRLARNIDNAKLNRLYYDYFFEGLLLSLVTKYLPILSILAYVNEAYRPGILKQLFGREYLFQLGVNPDPIRVGSVFWFVSCVLTAYLLWALIKRLVNGNKTAHA